MKREIKDYLHLYLGCEAAIGYDPKGIAGMRIDKIVEVGLSGATTSNHDFEKFEDITPLLRPLSPMEDNIKIELALLLGWDRGDDITKINSVNSLFDIGGFNNGYYVNVTNLSGSKWNKVISHLRKNSYDCDNLIPDGLALDATTINR